MAIQQSYKRSNRRHNKRILILLVFWTYFLHSYVIAGGDDYTDNLKNFAVAGYLPDYRVTSYMDEQLSKDENHLLGDRNNSPPKSMTDLILFSLQPHKKGFFGCCLQDIHYDLVRKFVDVGRHDAVNIWVTVGGGGRTEAFPEICHSETLRKRLIQSILNLRYVPNMIQGIRNTRTRYKMLISRYHFYRRPFLLLARSIPSSVGLTWTFLLPALSKNVTIIFSLFKRLFLCGIRRV